MESISSSLRDRKKQSLKMWDDLEPRHYDGVTNKELQVFDDGEVGPIGFFRFREDN